MDQGVQYRVTEEVYFNCWSVMTAKQEAGETFSPGDKADAEVLTILRAMQDRSRHQSRLHKVQV